MGNRSSLFGIRLVISVSNLKTIILAVCYIRLLEINHLFATLCTIFPSLSSVLTEISGLPFEYEKLSNLQVLSAFKVYPCQ